MVKIDYPYDYDDLPSHYVADPRVKGFVEGYAKALAAMMGSLTGDSPCGKSYDPLMVGEGELHSYAFDMKDGGRHHPLEDYDTVGDIMEILLKEALDWVKDDYTDGTTDT